MTATKKLTLQLSRVLLVTNLRTLRRARTGLQLDLEFLQENVAYRGSDAVSQGALLVLATEIELITHIIRELRTVLGGDPDDGPPVGGIDHRG